MRWSGFLQNTLKETPVEAETISHILMMRAGMIRKVAAGIYTYLPAFRRSLRKLEAIVREEMDRIGQEVLMPILTPAELWKESGRWDAYGKELMRVKDRKDADFALGPTHEEVVADLVRQEVKSYRQFPLCLYQIQAKFRDEIRPRFGVMRGREFLMKDAYSFHRDRRDLDRFYEVMHAAYGRIFRKVGLDVRAVLADSGMIGGKETHEFVVFSENGESGVLWCPDRGCGYAATDEVAEGHMPAVEPDEKVLPLEEVETPGCETIKDVADFLGVEMNRCAKAMIYEADGEIVPAFVRGDRQLNEAKLGRLAGASQIELATDAARIREAGLEPGYAGPVGLSGKLRVLADASLRDRTNLVVGANHEGYHLRGANWGRDMREPEFVDLTLAEAGDGCPVCNRPLNFSRGIEVGQIFKLDTMYSEALKAMFLDEQGREQPFTMGCYGIGLSRALAAVIEQHHDEHGIVWPVQVAPFEVVLTSLGVTRESVRETSDTLYQEMLDANLDVLYDDRDLSPGFKLKDADLIGIPVRVVVGERGLRESIAEVKHRSEDKVRKIRLDGVAAQVKTELKRLKAAFQV